MLFAWRILMELAGALSCVVVLVLGSVFIGVVGVLFIPVRIPMCSRARRYVISAELLPAWFVGEPVLAGVIGMPNEYSSTGSAVLIT